MTIDFELSAGMTCFLCYNCAPFTEWFAVDLPAGEYNVSCALIIGKRKASTDLKTSLNDALRDFNVAV